MSDVVIFLLISLFIIWLSWPSLINPHTYGFPRFFAFESVLVLILLNRKYWFLDPYSLHQIISWVCLILSLFLVIHTIHMLLRVGKPNGNIEATTQLVEVGAYRYVRHPMYSSLLFLGWGSFFKAPSWIGCALIIVATTSLVITAKVEEGENFRKFGDAYTQYLNQTKMFVPFVY